MQPSIAGQSPQPPKPPDIVYVNFSAEISVKTIEALLAAMAQFANNGVKKVYLALSTPGGEVSAGITLYNMLRGMPFELITHNVGNVDSIGNAIFLAGSTRYASPHSTFMFHGVGFVPQPNIRLEEKNCREMLDGILREHARIGTVIQERTSLDQAVIPELFREASTKDAAYALQAGIVHDIRDIQIPAGSPVVSLVFQR